MTYRPTTSQRRVILKNTNTQITISRPSVSEEKILLYNRYHLRMQQKKSWHFREINAEVYSENFVYGYGDFGYEISYKINGNLVGIGYFDVLIDSLSATYFFYDHSFSYLSLGTFNILTQLLFAKEKHLMYFYPGYWIKEHYSMGYKERFKPFEILQNMPDIFDTPIWLPHIETPKTDTYQQTKRMQNELDK